MDSEFILSVSLTKIRNMSIPAIDPLRTIPTNVDPRFRYGTRASPENFQEATARFYLPTQRDSRFWPLKYEGPDNECFDALTSKSAPTCTTDEDCKQLIGKWCTDGQAKYVEYRCQMDGGGSGECVYDFDAF
jgi:hypothetical protein